MDLTFVISAIILTLLAIVVATSLLSDSSSTADFPDARSHVGHRGDGASERSERCGPTQNGHVPDKKEAAVDDWCEISGSSHDHWDVVKSVLSEEASPPPHPGEGATQAELCSSTRSPSVPGSRNTSLEGDPSGRRSFIGLSDKELLKCAFSHPQTEGATESPEVQDDAQSNELHSLKYVPGKARSHHLQMMLSKEELEEEQRRYFNTDFNCL
ncbi:uncharacterized protein LOC114845821 isoform X2 [Betta splendens]|uniref:Uncharacterized protein LOC114845821 isoform X2 n=1 Tax=Betta splendens TaxID=158456 RepID=A0A9W2XFZ8_BETSP|nr:uncharacterized protein LOC114845821 isoform X2 [Betta splendens]